MSYLVGTPIKAKPLSGQKIYLYGVYDELYKKPAIAFIESDYRLKDDKHVNKIKKVLIDVTTIKRQFPMKDATGRDLYDGDKVFYRVMSGRKEVRRIKGYVTFGPYSDGKFGKDDRPHFEWEDPKMRKAWDFWKSERKNIFYDGSPKPRK